MKHLVPGLPGRGGYAREGPLTGHQLLMTISEREKATPECPTCKGAKLTPQFSGFTAQTKEKS